MAGNLIIPEVINQFNVYNADNKYMGISGEVSLATLSAVTAEVSGAGILGTYNTAVVGAFQSITQDIPFRMVSEEMFSMLDASQQAEIVLRSSVQKVNSSTGGTLSSQGMRVVFRGRPTAVNLGTLSQGQLMNASVTLELTYVMIEIGGQNKFELDKLNNVYKVNGKDLLEDIRNQC